MRDWDSTFEDKYRIQRMWLSESAMCTIHGLDSDGELEREENLLLMWRKLIMAKHQFAQETYDYLTYR